MNTKDYAVVVIFSRLPLRYICKFLEEDLGSTEDDIGVIKIDRKRDGTETNRTIVLLKKSLLDKAKESGYTESNRNLDFKMVEYEVRQYNLPKEGYTSNFFIPIPKEVGGENIRHQLQNKIDVLTKFGLFGEIKPYLNIPIESRETGNHKGRAFITFPRNMDMKIAALARICLHDTRIYLDEDKFELMKCYWARFVPKKRNKRPKKKLEVFKKVSEEEVSEEELSDEVSEEELKHPPFPVSETLKEEKYSDESELRSENLP